VEHAAAFHTITGIQGLRRQKAGLAVCWRRYNLDVWGVSYLSHVFLRTGAHK